MTDAITQRSLDYIASCDDPDKLRQIAVNAKREDNLQVRQAARLRLYAILPSEVPGTLEHDVWQSINALEDTLSDERGKTTRLSRTRQKIGRDRECKTVADLVLGKPSEGFALLAARQMIDLTFEAVALRHPQRFSAEVLEAARQRLSGVKVDVTSPK